MKTILTLLLLTQSAYAIFFPNNPALLVEDNPQLQNPYQYYIVPISDSCTGVLIGPNTILTAAHCISPSNKKQNYTPFPIRHGVNLPYSEGIERMVKGHYKHPKYKSNKDGSQTFFDYAIIYLESDPSGDAEEIEYPKLHVNHLYEEFDTSIWSYPSYLNNDYHSVTSEGELATTSCTTSSRLFKKDFIFHTCSTDIGSSGAPLFSKVYGEVDDEFKIVGLHLGATSGSNPFSRRQNNYALRITKSLIRNINHWILNPPFTL